MSEIKVRPATCHYPQGRILIAFWPLLLGAVCACGAVQGVLQGEKIGAAFFILAGGALFGFAVALLGLLQVMAVAADEEGLEATAFFGRIKKRLNWSEVASADYYEWPGERGSNKPPTGYALNRRGEPDGFSLRKRRIGFGEDMIGYDDLEKFLLQKSAEYGFPVQPGK